MKQIYFLRPVGKLGPIKIGCSNNPKRRASQISCKRKERVRVVATTPGGFDDEARLHRQFANSRVEQEWFAATDDLMAVIDQVLDTGKLPQPLQEDRNEVMKRRYLAGETLESIGHDYGLTRERVRQILRKSDCASLGYRKIHCRQPNPVADDEREMARLYLDGVRPKKLQGMFPHLEIRAVLRRTGTATKGTGFWNRRPDLDALTEQIVALYRAGVRSADIAEQVGLPGQCYIYRYLSRAGIKPSRKTQRSIDPSAVVQMVAEYGSGATMSALAERYGVAKPTVRRALVNSGVRITAYESERRRIVAVMAANRRRRAHGETIAA